MSKSTHPINISLKKLKHRNGLFLEDIWLSHLVDNSDAIPVQDILESMKDSLNFNLTERERYIEEVTIPTSFMNESSILIHKALVTGRSFIRDLNSGQHSYAETTAYNGCLYWARCILMILGVWVSSKKINESFWIIDIYPKKENRIDSKFNFIKLGNKQPGHVEIWLTLKRILNTSKNLPFDPQFIVFMDEIDESTIGFKRHQLQYINNYWINSEDLKLDCISINDLSWVKDFNEDIYAKLDLTDKSSENSLIYFYFILARNCYFLLNTIKPKLPSEFEEKFDEFNSSYNLLDVFIQKNWLNQLSDAF